MTTIVRVKRHRQDDAVEALILSCKRRKTGEDESQEDSFKTILSFSGTVEEKDDNVAASTIGSFSKKERNVLPLKSRVPDVTSKHRKETKLRMEESRFKVISCLRSLSVPESVDSSEQCEAKKNLTIVDVNLETDNIGSNNEGACSQENAFVYDLYSTNFEHEVDLNELYMDNLVSVHGLGSDLQYRCGEDFDEDELDPYEEDSNDENNWRNDYPDSDHSVNEDDMRLANQLKGFGIDDGCDLSGDSEEELYLNYDDSNGYTAEDIGGRNYARYKAQVLKDLRESEEDDDSY